VNAKAKLFARICSNPRDVRFDEACKAAELIGFTAKGGKGSHHGYARPGEPDQLNFQNHRGKVPTYQAKQLIRMIEKYYEGEL
jgi:HicA toxin of bacterial toxin-antitoxin,